jgi:hypothetical protein
MLLSAPQRGQFFICAMAVSGARYSFRCHFQFELSLRRRHPLQRSELGIP